jgi:hypothetical protein
MKWYLMAFTREVPEYLHVHVPGIHEWLLSQYDHSLHGHKMGIDTAVFETLAEQWWAQEYGKFGSRQPLRLEGGSSSRIHAGFVNMLEMDMSIIPEHRMTEISASPGNNVLVCKMWQPPEGASEEGRWRTIHAMLQCNNFSEVDGKYIDFYADSREKMQTQNEIRAKMDIDQTHRFYDELRTYVRREHGQKMPPAHRDGFEAPTGKKKKA